MITDMEKLFQPQRLEGESFEEYKVRRVTAKKHNKLSKRGVMVHVSKWFTVEQDKDGKDVVKVHHKTFRKPQE